MVDEIARKPIGRPWLTLAMDVDLPHGGGISDIA